MPTVPTHAALVISAPGQMRSESVPTKHPQAGEILVAPLRVGICGSDLDLLRGTRPLGTRILGHEGVARIVAVGPETPHFSVGQCVTFLPNNPNNPADILGVSTEGLNQRYLLVSQPALERGMVVPFEAGIPLVCGPLLEPFATVIYGQSLLDRVCKPERVAIVGAGPIGLLNALYARGQGCSEIFLIDTSSARLDWAVKRGIVEESHALLNSPQLVEMLLERTPEQGIDAAYLCTPRSATRSVLKQALRFVREEGGISLTAGADSSEELSELPGIDVNKIRQANICGLGQEVKTCVTSQGKKLWLTGHSGASASHLQQAMRILLKEAATYARVISHLVSYHAAPRVFEYLLAAEQQSIAGAPGIKVIVDFTSEAEEITLFDPQRLFAKEA
jgi:threonine dehydrogenase-like Zn-dependent dehydrogenase